MVNENMNSAKFPSPPGEAFMNSWYPILFALGAGALYGFRAYMSGENCRSTQKMNGKTVLITGANSGMGFEVAKEMAFRGARVIFACRNELKATSAMDIIRQQLPNADLVYHQLDLSSFTSIRMFADAIVKSEKYLHVLVNNAGTMCHPRKKSEDGFEIHFQTNYLGHFLLTYLLLDKLRSSESGRIINVTAPAYQIGDVILEDINFDKREYDMGAAYSQSKMALVLFTRHLAKVLEGSKVTANVAQPGIVNTNLFRYMPLRTRKLLWLGFSPFIWLLMKSAKSGAQTVIYCCVATEEEGVSGKLFSECHTIDPEPAARNDQLAEKLWSQSIIWTGN